MLWACIALPQLALDTVLRQHENPERPLVLLGGPTQRRHLVAVNPAAQALGLRIGQRLTEAQAISDDFTALPHDPADKLRQQQWLAGWAYRYTHQVSLDWPDSLMLEVGASLPLMGGWPHLEARLRSELRALGFSYHLALAPSAQAACLLAWLQDGLYFFEQAPMLDALARVPVRRARLPDDSGEQLHRMGIRRLGALFDTPRDSLRRRFGEALLDCLDRLRGLQPEVLRFYQPPEHFERRIELAWRVEHHAPLLFPLRRLIGDLVAFLGSRDRGVQHFELLLAHDGSTPPTRLEIGLSSAERDPALLFELAAIRLEQCRLPASVCALSLLARALPSFVPARADLFAQTPAGQLPWAQLRERLRARLGADALFQIEAVADHRPERAWRRRPDGTPAVPTPCAPPDGPPHPALEAQPPAPGQRPAAAVNQPLRPGWLLPEPIPLPSAVARIISGPERLESGWWDGEDARRDYYLLETREGQRAWAYREVGREGPWMLHGWFG